MNTTSPTTAPVPALVVGRTAPVEGICESCDDLALLVPVTDESGETFLVCPACA